MILGLVDHAAKGWIGKIAQEKAPLRSDNYLGRSATIILAGRVAREHRL